MAHERIDFLHALIASWAKFEARAAASFPVGEPIPLRAGGKLVYISADKPVDYVNARKLLLTDAVDRTSFLILAFLYAHEKYSRHNPDAFDVQNRHRFSEEEWNSIELHFPLLNQSELAKLLHPIPNSTLNAKLDVFERIGWITRNKAKPPRPRFPVVSDRGVAVIEGMVDDSALLLALAVKKLRPNGTIRVEPRLTAKSTSARSRKA